MMRENLARNIHSMRGKPSNRSKLYRSNRAVPSSHSNTNISPQRNKFTQIQAFFLVTVVGLAGTSLYLTHVLTLHSNIFNNWTNGKHDLHGHIIHHKATTSDIWNKTLANKGQPMQKKPKENDVKMAKAFVHHNEAGKDTPALIGSSRGHIDCDVDVDDLVYWNDPQGVRDVNFISPFQDDPLKEDNVKYVTFEIDRGGWNNMRMSMETIFVFAAATGRTIVLPPDQPLYLLNKDSERKQRGFADFFPIYSPEFQKRVPVITAEEFVRKEGGVDGRLPVRENKEKVKQASIDCVNRKKEGNFCGVLYDHYADVGYVVPLNGSEDCLIFDQNSYQMGAMDVDVKKHIEKFCGEERSPFYYTKQHQMETSIHFASNHKSTRLFNHFYSFILFTDPVIDNHYKRFVRDFLHYRSSIFCAAGKVIKAIQMEGQELGFNVDDNGAGAYSALHIRRGDFQFKKQRISASEWWENTKEIWLPNEILYIATDEKSIEFFDPIKEHHKIRFLNDYWDEAGLDSVDPNYIGMIETIVASRGRAFVGTWFSTFTAYINRMRGYHGMDMKNSWYGKEDHKYEMHNWTYPHPGYVSREWPLCWTGIDTDKFADTDTMNMVDDEAQNLGRGVSGLDISKTPSLIGAKRAHIECDINVDVLAYWNDPQGTADISFISPFSSNQKKESYLTFELDSGGWNNIRMSMENIFIIAAATGRTLVMPPEQPLYLLDKDSSKRTRGFADFFPLDKPEFKNHVKIITMDEFIKREGGDDGHFPIPKENRKAVWNARQSCFKRKKSENSCFVLFDYLRSAGEVPNFNGGINCLIFDENAYNGKPPGSFESERISEFCGHRVPVYYNGAYHDKPLIHLQASDKDHRLLNHFYGLIFFTNPRIDNFYKRFVRDFLHYIDPIFCAAGKIVHSLRNESRERNLQLDGEGRGGYSSIHIRRGDFQYKRVKISGQEWQTNTQDLFSSNEILYIATDEKDKSFFNPLAAHHTLKFLDDYWDYAGLGNLDPNFMGMIDTIVASRGRIFVGTFFSTFSGYINRMRGYHGMTMKDSFYGTKDKKTITHTWETVPGNVFSREWPSGWVGIDGDTIVSKEVF